MAVLEALQRRSTRVPLEAFHQGPSRGGLEDPPEALLEGGTAARRPPEGPLEALLDTHLLQACLQKASRHACSSVEGPLEALVMTVACMPSTALLGLVAATEALDHPLDCPGGTPRVGRPHRPYGHAKPRIAWYKPCRDHIGPYRTI